MASRRLSSMLLRGNYSNITKQLTKSVPSLGASGGTWSEVASLSSHSRSVATALLQSMRSSSQRGLQVIPMGMAAMGHQMLASMPPPADPPVARCSSSLTQQSAGAGVPGDSSDMQDDDEGVIPIKKRLPSISRHHYTASLHQHLPHSLPGHLLVKSISSSSVAALGMAASQVSPVRGSASSGQPNTVPEPTSNADAVQAFMKQHDVRVFSPAGDVPAPVLTFEQAGFPAAILKTVRRAGFGAPTPIQSQAWPVAMSKQDLVAIASTGSGKTAGYLLPALARVFTGDLRSLAPTPTPQDTRGSHRHHHKPYNGPLVLVMAPTRELAKQIQEQAYLYGRPLGVESLAVYGGVKPYAQRQGLRTLQPQVLVATPGRLLDLHDQMCVNLSDVQYLVLDEADRMLDMGFEDDIRHLVSLLPSAPTRQTLFFSATWPKEVRSLARDLAGAEPVTVFLGKVSDQAVAARTITQEVQLVPDSRAKLTAVHTYLQQLLQQAQEQQGVTGQVQERHRKGAFKPHQTVDAFRAIIFTGTKMKASTLQEWLSTQEGMPRTAAIHGDCSQAHRESALEAFRSGRVGILVATDVAARGLDIPNVNVVINFDVPQAAKSEDYVHRIGRTGRAGAQGRSLALINTSEPQDLRFAAALTKIMREAGQAVSPELQECADHSQDSPHHRHADQRWGGRGRGGYYGHSRGGSRSSYSSRGSTRGPTRDREWGRDTRDREWGRERW